MKHKIAGLFGLIFIMCFTVQAQTDEREAVRQAALDYVEGVYEVDPARIERSVHPELTKLGFYTKKGENDYSSGPMTFKELVELTKTYNKNGRIPKTAPKEVVVYEVSDQTASAKVTAVWGIDYLHLAKYAGRWKIINILWQTPPKNMAQANAVESVVESLFANMAAHKPDKILEHFTADSQLAAVIKSPDGKTNLKMLKAGQFANQFAEKKAELKELMYDMKTEVHEDLASVSGRYVFFINNKISHCGINAFHLVRLEDRWKIAGASTTIEPGGCTKSEREMKAD